MNADTDPQGAGERPTPTGLVRRLLKSRAAIGGLAVGVLLFVVVMVWQGLDEVMLALRTAGWGVVTVALLHIPQMWADGMGWRRLVTSVPLRRRTFVWARWIGESVNDLLPVLQMGGNVVKAWLLVDCGVAVGAAGGSVVVDVTLVVLSQIVFTLFGVSLLIPTLGGGKALPLVVAGTGIMAVLLAGFYFAQRRGLFGIAAKLAQRILAAPDWAAFSTGASAIDAEVARVYRDRRAVIASAAWHLTAWFVGIGEVWYALYLLGHPVDVWTALLFESLGQAIRTGAFAVPGALGVQEGGYVLVGSAFGIPPGAALGLSLVRRMRELLVGIPGLITWQIWTLRRNL